MLILLFIILAPMSQALTDEALLSEWTKKNETNLLEKYTPIDSEWFEKECLTLAKRMEFNKLIKCKVLDSSIINAYVFNNGHVYFSLAMMQQINNIDQWAAILAHENAHVELHHYLMMLNKVKNPSLFFRKSKMKKMLKENEAQADQWSKSVLEHNKFDYSQINYFLKRVAQLKGDKNNNKHLKLTKRIKQTNNIEIIDKILIKKIELLK